MAKYSYKHLTCLGQKLGFLDNEVDSEEVLLFFHGFPERAYTWERYLDYYKNKGVRAIAIELKGYKESPCSSNDLGEYSLDVVCNEIIDFKKQLKLKNVHLVGHDWGAIVVWYLSTFYHESFMNAVTLNAPHWLVFKKALLSNPKQMMKSWYIFLINIKKLSMKLLKINDFQLLKSSIKKGSHGKLPDALIESYCATWAECLPSMTSWYRAMRYTKDSDDKVKVPMILLMGDKDPFFVKSLAQQSMEYCEDGRFTFVKDCAHFIHHENEAVVLKELDQLI
tara:strand:+ start:84925 stop:85764 length:840 start_codon:yes stop_codon:yes gene_type:complete